MISSPDETTCHWGWVTHICANKLNTIGSDNGLSPGRHQAIIWTNAGILLIWPLGTNFNEMLIEIHTFSFKKIHLKISSAKWWPFVSFQLECCYSSVAKYTWIMVCSTQGLVWPEWTAPIPASCTRWHNWLWTWLIYYEQNGCHCADGILKRIFSNESCWFFFF